MQIRSTPSKNHPWRARGFGDRMPACSGNAPAWGRSRQSRFRAATMFAAIAATIVVLSLGRLPELSAQENTPQPIVSNVRPVHPILIRNEHGPLLRVVIDVPAGPNIKVSSIEFSFAGTDDLRDLATVRLFATGNQDAFSTAMPLGEPIVPAPTLSIPVDRSLVEGKNVFWLSGRLQDTADLQHQIVATCTAIVTATGKLLPRDDVANPRQRIGVALRKHNDDEIGRAHV